jgi:hypothetical protein
VSGLVLSCVRCLASCLVVSVLPCLVLPYLVLPCRVLLPWALCLFLFCVFFFSFICVFVFLFSCALSCFLCLSSFKVIPIENIGMLERNGVKGEG